MGKAVGQDVWRLQEPELGAVLAGLEAVRRDAERLLVAVTGEALSRGVPGTSGFSSGEIGRASCRERVYVLV